MSVRPPTPNPNLTPLPTDEVPGDPEHEHERPTIADAAESPPEQPTVMNPIA